MKNSEISWTDHTFNPWIGCTKVSPGCAHCYAEQQDKFRSWTPEGWGAGKPRKRTSVSNWNEVKKWNRTAAAAIVAARDQVPMGLGDPANHFPRPRVFCASLADWLDDEVPAEWLRDLLDLVASTPALDWLLLTKRPENWLRRITLASSISTNGEKPVAGMRLMEAWIAGSAPANVWIGTTVEDQQRADERIPQLLRIPARVRFLSCEPLLWPVNVAPWFYYGSKVGNSTGIHWVICGGESGPGARPMHPDWARSLRDQCAAAGVAFHFKQWGEWAPGECVNVTGSLSCASFDGNYWDYSKQTETQSQHCHADDAPDMFRIGKKAAGRLLDGVTHAAFPEVTS